MRGLGYIPDPVAGKARDWPLAALLRAPAFAPRASVVPIERQGDLRPLVVDVLDQGGIGSCVANAGMAGIRCVHRRDRGGKPPLGARMPAYYLCRSYIGTTREDSGCHIRDFWRGANEFGFSLESKYPYVDARFRDRPPPEWQRDAFDQRGKDPANMARYWRVFDPSEMRAALDANMPVVIGAMVSYEFTAHTGRKVFDVPNPAQIAGGHAMLVVAHDLPEIGAGTFTAVGSWGEGAHDRGYHHFSEAYAEEFIDCWAVESVPYYSEVA